MGSTLRFGRIRGIEVGAHWSVLVFAGVLAWSLTGGQRDLELWLVVIGMVVVFLACLLAHELGHSIVAQRNGLRVRSINLWLLGGVAQLEGRLPSPGVTFRVAAAGPAVSYALAGVLFGLYYVAGGGEPFEPLLVQALGYLAAVNVILGTFNLIPAAPLDGGRILTSAVWKATGDRTKAEVVATTVGQGAGILAIALGIVGPMLDWSSFSVWTAILGIFVFQAASAEKRFAVLAGAFTDARVRDVMSPHPVTLPARLPVAAAIERLRSAGPSFSRYPVVGADGAVAGVVTRSALSAVPPAAAPATLVENVATSPSGIGVATPDDLVLPAVAAVRDTELRTVLVFDRGALVGIVTPSDMRRRPRRAGDSTPVV